MSFELTIAVCFGAALLVLLIADLRASWDRNRKASENLQGQTRLPR